MTSTQQKGLSSSRVCDSPSANVDLLQCPICHDLLWKPVACQSCKTPFCSVCINQWLINNPNECPNQCETYIERKCPPVIVQLLAQLQIRCSYQEQGCEEVISYEALDKHEIECGYQSQKCPGCRSEILKKDFDNHKNDCALIELACQDCKLIYKRGDAITKHTENICLKEQLRQLRDESKNTTLEMQELSRQLREIRALSESDVKFNLHNDRETTIVSDPMPKKLILNFADLPSADEQSLPIPNKYKGLKWTKFGYMHKSFATNKYPESGYVTAFTCGGSPHIAIFKDEASIAVERPNETFTLISLSTCAVWKDDLQLTIKGYQNSAEINAHTTILRFGKPQLILLEWKNIDKIAFKSSGGTLHPGSRDSAGCQVVLTQLVSGQLD